MVLREGMRPMKSFGVRLAAGAGTILVVAYAIALAQKDNQAASDTWQAESAVDPNPAVPIAEAASSAWLEQPVSEIADQQQALTFQDSTAPSLPVTQVNYEQIPDTASTFAVTENAEPSANPAGESEQTVIVPPPQASDAVDFPLAAEIPALGDGSFQTPESFAQPETTETLALPESDPTGLANPTLNTPPNTEADLNASSPSLPAGFGETLPNATAVAAAALTASTEADAGLAGSTMDEFPEPNLSALTNPSAPDTQPNTAGETASEAIAADAALGVPTDASAMDFFPQDANSSNAGQPSSTAELAPANTLRAAAPVQNQLRAVSPDAALAAGETASQFPDANLMQADPTGLPNSPSMPSAAPASVGEPFAAENTSTAVLAAGPSVMAPASDPVATAASATLQTAPTPAAAYPSSPVDMVPPNTAMALAPNATTDAPGERRLEGAQTPSVIIQKRAPAEVKVGKPAAFIINVRNVGSVEALDVEVHDRIPAGMRLADASPVPQIRGNLLMWQIGSMPAGDERTITLQLIPEQEGELGSVARVSFEAAASVRTIATKPVLKIEQQAPKQVLIGQQLEIALTYANTGSGKATNVEIWEDVPTGLSHPEGPQLKQTIGTLMPGEVRTDSLFLKAEKAGTIQNTVRLVGDDGLTTEETISIEVIAPQLQVSLQGPSRRFLERQAKYELNVANAGTAAATNVEISVQLSRGFTFVSTDFEGQYDPNRHAVFWSLAQLPAGASGVVPLTLLPVETGEQVIKINANADLTALAQTERKMTVEGFADLSFSITNPKGPIEVGAETTYDILVQNSGSKPDTNIRVQMQLPAGLELLSVDGDAGTDGNGLVAFQPKAQLAPGQKFNYRVRARGTTAGTHIVKAVVVSDQSTVPVTKEDTTRVYADQ